MFVITASSNIFQYWSFHPLYACFSVVLCAYCVFSIFRGRKEKRRLPIITTHHQLDTWNIKIEKISSSEELYDIFNEQILNFLKSSPLFVPLKKKWADQNKKDLHSYHFMEKEAVKTCSKIIKLLSQKSKKLSNDSLLEKIIQAENILYSKEAREISTWPDYYVVYQQIKVMLEKLEKNYLDSDSHKLLDETVHRAMQIREEYQLRHFPRMALDLINNGNLERLRIKTPSSTIRILEIKKLKKIFSFIFSEFVTFYSEKVGSG